MGFSTSEASKDMSLKIGYFSRCVPSFIQFRGYKVLCWYDLTCIEAGVISLTTHYFDSIFPLLQVYFGGKIGTVPSRCFERPAQGTIV